MYWHEEFSKFEAISADHPVSLGYRVFLLTDCTLVSENARLTKRQTNLLHWNEPDERTEAPLYCGMHAVWDKFHAVGVFISGTYGGKSISPRRFIELLTHECSHAVDFFFERAAVNVVHTEIRAYYLDWMVGKLTHSIPLFD